MQTGCGAADGCHSLARILVSATECSISQAHQWSIWLGAFRLLQGAIALGPRIGKYNSDGTPNAIPGHHIPMAVLGTLILTFGWFGFNPGSTLAGTDLRIGVVAVNTMLASVAGSFTAML